VGARVTPERVAQARSSAETVARRVGEGKHEARVGDFGEPRGEHDGVLAAIGPVDSDDNLCRRSESNGGDDDVGDHQRERRVRARHPQTLPGPNAEDYGAATAPTPMTPADENLNVVRP
jgi:hypothetical protein